MTKNVIVKLSVLFAKQYYSDMNAQRNQTIEQFVDESVSKYLSIAQKIAACEANLVVLQKEVNLKKEALRNEQKEVWKQCDHPIKSYHPDPSGNNDSYYECEVCGKEI